MQTLWLRAAFSLTAAGWGANQFSSLLGFYQTNLGLPGSVVSGLFAVYVVGLLPGLLLGGPVADRCGRKPVVISAVGISLVASLCLMAGPVGVVWIATGRLLAGVSTGAALAAGSSWVKDLSHPPHGDATDAGPAARRAGIFLSAGFALSGLISAMVAQWAPAPMLTAYYPHLLLSVGALTLAFNLPETRSPTAVARSGASGVGHPRFRWLVLPVAPWVFAAASVGFAVLPGQVADQVRGYETLYAGIATVLTPGTGALIQPLGRRLALRNPIVPALAGLTVVAVGFALGAVSAGHPVLALVASVLLGSGYGLCVTFGLTEVGRIAPPGGLAGLTAIFWVLAYVGFCAPYVFTLLSPVASVPVILGCCVLLVAMTGALVLTAHRRLPRLAGDQPDRDGQESRRADQVH